jgi:hypothetical protein
MLALEALKSLGLMQEDMVDKNQHAVQDLVQERRRQLELEGLALNRLEAFADLLQEALRQQEGAI